MKKVFLCFLLLSILLLTACGNRQIIDTKWTFTEGFIDFGGEIKEVKIRSWKDYEGDAVQITTTDGDVYLTSYKNVILKGK